MSKKIAKHDVDLANLPPLTEKQKAELAVLAARPDGEIDYSDLPPLNEEFWKKAVRAAIVAEAKSKTP